MKQQKTLSFFFNKPKSTPEKSQLVEGRTRLKKKIESEESSIEPKTIQESEPQSGEPYQDSIQSSPNSKIEVLQEKKEQKEQLIFKQEESLTVKQKEPLTVKQEEQLTFKQEEQLETILPVKKMKQEEDKSDLPVAKSNRYHPVHDAIWKKGEAVPYLALSRAFEEIEKNAGRLRMIELLTNLFRSILALTPQDLLPCVYLAANKLAPEYEGVELGIGTSILLKSISEATGRAVPSLKASLDEMGDLGAVAQASKLNQRMMVVPAKLTIQSVFKKLFEIAKISGNASQNKKKDLIKSLLVAGRESEPLFIIRALEGKLRIGLAEKSVLTALAHAFVLTPPNSNVIIQFSSHDLEKKLSKANEIIRSVFSELPNYEAIIQSLLKSEGDFDQLRQECQLTPGIPVKPMLAQPTKGVQEVLDRFTDTTFTCEFKYDGERAQIHFVKNQLFSIYSRNLEDNTGKYPDLIKRLPNALKNEVSSFILDCEVVAWDPSSKKILPFQVLSTRARKGVAIEDIKVQVCLFAFDLLYLNGKSLVREPLNVRREALRTNFLEISGELIFAKNLDSTDTEEIQSFLEEAVEGNCEGLMVKTLHTNATYEPSRRSFSWLKVKKDYIQGMGDSLDLVVMGAYMGRGKRTGVYGGYLLGCYDEDTEEIQSICKIGTGFSDEFLQQSTKFFKDHVISAPKPYYVYADQLRVEVWFEPVQVWEVLAADLSISPVHRAAEGVVDPSRGIALRFPRFVRIREDKKVEQATSSSQVADMYRSQKINHQHISFPLENDEDF